MSIDQLDAIAQAATPDRALVAASSPAIGSASGYTPTLTYHKPATPTSLRSRCPSLTGDAQALPKQFARQAFAPCQHCYPDGDPR